VKPFLDWGIEGVLWFQQFSPALDLPFKSLTFLGNLEFFLICMPLIYWCLDRRLGARLLVLFLISAYINSVAKVIADQPRPFHYDSRVRALVHAGGGGLPSGHTQSAVVVWGYLASQAGRRMLWILAVILMVAIPMSRLYLGVHFPTDLLGGYILGILLLVLYLHFGLKVEAWLIQKGIIWQMGLAVSLPILFICVNPKDSIVGICSGNYSGASLDSILCRGKTIEQNTAFHPWIHRFNRHLDGTPDRLRRDGTGRFVSNCSICAGRVVVRAGCPLAVCEIKTCRD
jgi:membrane-associated phospholipid phosphatase